jgi:hypothetical protein
MIQWEECSLDVATHVEINGEMHEIKTSGNQIKTGGKVIKSGDIGWINILLGENKWARIPKEAFPILGIKCLRKKKQEPIEFEATFASCNGEWHPLYSLDDGFAHQNNKKAKFKCVEILEEKK